MKMSEPKRLRVVVTTDSEAKHREVLLPDTRPGDAPKAGNCDFILNPDQPVDADFWIVFGNARTKDVMHCAPENTLFIAAEPESKKIYPRKFYRQFHRVVDAHEKSGHPRITLHAPCLNWHIGLNHETKCFDRSHDELSAIPCPEKPINKVSVVCSSANHTEGQRTRLRFLSELKEHLGDDLVHFGRGFTQINDKFDAILNYRFHLVLENCQLPHYWTEKLVDSYIGWAFPIYVGAPDLESYFPKHTFTPISMDSACKAAETIRDLLDKPRDQTEIDALELGRDLAMNTYNPWNSWARWAEQFHLGGAEKRDLRILSHKAFRPFPRGLIHRLGNLFH